MTAAAVIAQASLTAWTRETAAQLRLSVAAIKWLTAGAVSMAFALGVLLALVAGDHSGMPESTLTAGTLSFMLASSFLTIAFLSALFSLLGPSKNALATVLEMLPATRTSVFVGLQVPVLALSYILSVCLTLPSFAALWRNSQDWLQGAMASVGLAVFMGCTQLFVLAVFQCLGYLFRRYLRLPRYYALTFAGVSCFALSIALVWTDVLPIPASMTEHIEGARDNAAHRVWARGLAPLWGGPPAAWNDLLMLVLWLALPLALMLLVTRLDIDNQADATLRVFANTCLPRNRFLAAAYTDAVQLLRSHQFIVLLLLTSLALGGLTLLSRHEEFGFIAYTFAPGIAVAPFILGMQSYGLTVKTHWLQRHLHGRPTAWAGPKLAGTATISLIVGTLFIGTLMAFGLVSAEQLPAMLGDGAIAWCAAAIGGILVPFSREQPLASGATGFTVFLIYAAASASAHWSGPELGKLFGDAPYLGDVFTTSLVLIILAGILTSVCFRVSRDA
jgi:hypothetical protein